VREYEITRGEAVAERTNAELSTVSSV